MPLRDCAWGFVGLGQAAALGGQDHDREACPGGFLLSSSKVKQAGRQGPTFRRHARRRGEERVVNEK